MLSATHRAILRREGIATLHDYRVVSLASGEPFFDDGVLSYYDGRALLICTQPLRGRPQAEADAVRECIRQWTSEHRIDFILYVGPSPFSFPHLVDSGFEQRAVHARIARSAELFLPARPEFHPRGMRRAMRRATRNGFVARHRRGGIVDARYLTLTEHFYRRLCLSEYLAELAISLPALIMSRDTTIIEAWEGEAMRGFVTVHEPFDGVSVAMYIAHDSTSGVSDFLYAQLLEHALHAGSEFVNVGPSPSAGHYRFKLKWCGVPMVPPYYASTWVRGRAKCSRWLLRILSYNNR